ncbi:hypothetical protein HNY73_011767 [Argiope bruennichi]|uniref:Uncharacterized protein n=1 Tax=Argiope bruennichi TaxID=94029 RepID=A0A8T0ESV2_ARGBR|nr:hypothetical protein HNY73_011767 [Argiope bruennichi]
MLKIEVERLVRKPRTYFSADERRIGEKTLESLRQKLDAEAKALEKLDPCTLLHCTIHPDHKQNICQRIQRHTESKKYLQETIESFDMTLQQMSEDNQDHTKQYLDDLNKQKELKLQLEYIEEELALLNPCPIDNCNLHAITDENNTMEIEQPFQVVEKRHVAKRKKSADSQEIIVHNIFVVDD